MGLVQLRGNKNYERRKLKKYRRGETLEIVERFTTRQKKNMRGNEFSSF